MCEKVICGTPEDPAWVLGDEACVYKPPNQLGGSSVDVRKPEEEGTHSGDPAQEIAMEAAALAKKALRA